MQAKLSVLEQTIGEFDLDNRDNEFKRSKTRLRHLNQRIERVMVQSEDALGIKQQLINKCVDLLADLSLAYAGIAAAPTQFNDASEEASSGGFINLSRECD